LTSKPTIDLDLVKFRAKLRKWHICDNVNTFAVYHPTADPTEAPKEVRFDARTGAILVSTSEWFEEQLTGPRWTLERLFSEPPSGWAVVRENDRNALAYMNWGAEHDGSHFGWDTHEATIALRRFPLTGGIDALSVVSSAQGKGLTRLAERHEAAAELANILAEIQP